MNLVGLIMSGVNLSCVTSWLHSWAALWSGNTFKLVLNQDDSGSMTSIKTPWPSWKDWICLPTLWCWCATLDRYRSVLVRQEGTAHQNCWTEAGGSAFVTLVEMGVSPSWLMEFPLCSWGSDCLCRISSVRCLGNAQWCPGAPFIICPGTLWQIRLSKGLVNVWCKEQSLWPYREILFTGTQQGRKWYL